MQRAASSGTDEDPSDETGRPVRRVIGALLALYAASAVIGFAISTDATRANQKAALIGASLAVFLGVVAIPRRFTWRGWMLDPFRLLIATVPVLLAIYFVLTTDWSRPAEKVVWLEPLRAWLASRSAQLHLPPVHPNIAGGLLAMWLPLQIAALMPHDGSRSNWRTRAPAVCLVGICAAALLLSGLRGAWFALAVAVPVRLVWRHLARLAVSTRLTVLGLGAIGGVVLWVLTGPTWLAQRPDRLLVWANSGQLGADYLFTGLGLGNFSMPYSSYALLVHVPHTMHAHNLFLDLWLEQGLLGLLSFTALMLLPLTWWSNGTEAAGPATAWREAGLIALLAVILHGLVDDVYYGYDGLGLPLLFTPLAVLVRTAGPAAVGRLSVRSRWPVAGAVILLLLTVVFQRDVRARWHANLGAVQQTRTELSIYRWPEWPVQDAVRQARVELLAGAIQHYRDALTLNPRNAQANRRLGQIELSLGRFDSARQLLSAAYQSAPDQQTTRQLYGESLALTGDPTRAADIWRGLDFSQDQLAIRLWWHRRATEKRVADWLDEAISLPQMRQASSNF